MSTLGSLHDGNTFGLPEGLDFKELTKTDLPAIMEIERASFPTPWPEKAFLDELKTEWSYLYGVVDPRRNILLGYCNYWVVLEDAHLLSLAVSPAQRRKGIGSAMLLFAMDHAYKLGARRIHLEVRKGNEPAKAMYKAMGFKMVGIRKMYYVNEGEDAIVFKKALTGHKAVSTK